MLPFPIRGCTPVDCVWGVASSAYCRPVLPFPFRFLHRGTLRSAHASALPRPLIPPSLAQVIPLVVWSSSARSDSTQLRMLQQEDSGQQGSPYRSESELRTDHLSRQGSVEVLVDKDPEMSPLLEGGRWVTVPNLDKLLALCDPLWRKRRGQASGTKRSSWSSGGR